MATLAAEAEVAEETERLQEGVVESGVVVTPTKPKKGKAALPLKSDRVCVISFLISLSLEFRTH